MFEPMPIKDHLPKSLGRKDQKPNKDLARKIFEGSESLNELIAFINSKPHKDFEKDAVLTLAYLAEQSPSSVAPHWSILVNNLDADVNRVIWGSMIALSHIAHLIQEPLFAELPKILDAMNKGTPVTRDHGFRILMALYANDELKEDIYFIVLEQLQLAPKNQLGQYADRFTTVVVDEHKAGFITALEILVSELDNEYHLRRINKCLKKLRK